MQKMPKNAMRDLKRFYELLDKLKHRLGGAHRLQVCTGRGDLNESGVYFVFEDGERRSDSGDGTPRVVHIGMTNSDDRTLQQRFNDHRGFGYNRIRPHQSSVLRAMAGNALMRRRNDLSVLDTWNRKEEELGLSEKEISTREKPIEEAVSEYVSKLQFIWVMSEYESVRKAIKENAILLLHAVAEEGKDPASEEWLGNYYEDRRGENLVVRSGIWSRERFKADYDHKFLRILESCTA